MRFFKASLISFPTIFFFNSGAIARPLDDESSVSLSKGAASDSTENVLSPSGFYGWHGCSSQDRATISKARRDSRDVLGARPVHELADWKQLPESIDFFGHAVANDYHGWSTQVQQNFRNAYDFADGTSDVAIQVFCHDESMRGPLRHECSATRQPDPVVVARNYLGRDGPALMFCDSWFEEARLAEVQQKGLDAGADLDRLDNQARSLMTALMLVPAIAPWPQDHYGPSMIYRKQTLPGSDAQQDVTSAAACKVLAAIEDANRRRTITNADTYSWYAMAAYVRDNDDGRR